MPDENDDLSLLLSAVRRRDEAAARRLVERLGPLVLRIVRAHQPRRVAEEDLCQEVFMSVFADLGQYRGTVPFERWVARVAVTTCFDALRREKARSELRWADLSEAEVAALETMRGEMCEAHGEDRTAARELVAKLLETLPPGFATRIAARWAAGDEPATLFARVWEVFALRAAVASCAAALMVGWALHGSLLDSRRAAREGSAQEIELVQIEELFWTP